VSAIDDPEADVMRALGHHSYRIIAMSTSIGAGPSPRLDISIASCATTTPEIIAAGQQQANERIALACDFRHGLAAESLEVVPLSQK
jgi:hypothetical protein